MTKDEARARTAASRARRSAPQLEADDTALGAHEWRHIITGSGAHEAAGAGAFVTCYAAMAGEPPTAALTAALAEAGWRVALPVMSPGRSLAWGWQDADLRPNGYGVRQPEPDHGIRLADAAALIIPAQRAGIDGSRLGRGAGYYDRALASIAVYRDGGPLRIAVVFDDEVDARVPRDDWDQPVDVIVTPQRVHRVAR